MRGHKANSQQSQDFTPGLSGSQPSLSMYETTLLPSGALRVSDTLFSRPHSLCFSSSWPLKSDIGQVKKKGKIN